MFLNIVENRLIREIKLMKQIEARISCRANSWEIHLSRWNSNTAICLANTCNFPFNIIGIISVSLTTLFTPKFSTRDLLPSRSLVLDDKTCFMLYQHRWSGEGRTCNQRFLSPLDSLLDSSSTNFQQKLLFCGHWTSYLERKIGFRKQQRTICQLRDRI